MTHETIDSQFYPPDSDRPCTSQSVSFVPEPRPGQDTDESEYGQAIISGIEFVVVELKEDPWTGIPQGNALQESGISTADEAQPGSELVSAVVKEVESAGWWKRHNAKVYLGLAAAGLVGTGVGVANGSFESITSDVKSEAPWAVPALIGSEALFIGGLAGMAAGTGKEIGNPLTIRRRMPEILAAAVDNKAIKAGLAVNTLGALGTAGVVAGAAVKALPPETWPAALGFATADVASTLALRAGAYKGSRLLSEKAKKREVLPNITARLAKVEDIDRMADIDLELFDKAYGEEKPSKKAVVDMLTRRLHNGGECMFVAELDGKVEGFVSAFLTDSSADEFSSWEHSTNNGTLDGKVAHDGNYLYVTNMTIRPNASQAGAKEMLMANMIAFAVEAGAEYGYFESRMPLFKRWLDRQKKNGLEIDDNEALDSIAEQYMDLRMDNGNRYDPLLRMYEGYGYQIDRLVPDAFSDDASLGYGVICKADNPLPSFLLRSKLARKASANVLRWAAKSPKLIRKII